MTFLLPSTSCLLKLPITKWKKKPVWIINKNKKNNGSLRRKVTKIFHKLNKGFITDGVTREALVL